MTSSSLAGGRDGKREPKLNPSKSLHGGPSFPSGCSRLVGDNHLLTRSLPSCFSVRRTRVRRDTPSDVPA